MIIRDGQSLVLALSTFSHLDLAWLAFTRNSVKPPSGRTALVHTELMVGICFCQLVVFRPVRDLCLAFIARCLRVSEPYGTGRSSIDGLLNCQL